MLCSAIEHDMTAFRIQTAQRNSASLGTSVWQFENSSDPITFSITEQRTPFCFNYLIKPFILVKGMK